MALATCAEYPRGDEEEMGPLLDALAALDLRATCVPWDDEGAAWDGFDLVVVRATWDYVGRHEEFLAWTETVPRLCNPAAVLRWNTDKTYLADLAGRGLAVVPTTWIAPGEGFEVPGHRYVVKPSIGAGAKDSASFDAGDPAGRALVEVIHASGRTAMLQPYLDAVDQHGETALIFMEGAFSHAINKGPILVGPDPDANSLYRAENIRAHAATDEECAAAEAVLAAVPFSGPLLYGRVDLVRGSDGGFLVLELELTEPSLFLHYDAQAPARFARAIASRLAAQREN